MDTAVVFYIERLKLTGKAKCFGVRFNTQYLPYGSVVVGFIKRTEHGRDQVFAIPSLTSDQVRSWNNALFYVEAFFKNDLAAQMELIKEII